MLVTFQALFTLLNVEKFENTTVTGYFELCVWELSRCHEFQKAPVRKCLLTTLKCKAGVFQIHPV